MRNRPARWGALLRPGELSTSTVGGSLAVPTCVPAKEPLTGAQERARPLLMVDIDGVISLFGGWPRPRERAGEGAIDGRLHSIEGIPHFLSATAAGHLLELSRLFEIVWASGWEERADEHLPLLLGLPAGLPFLHFTRAVGAAHAHWKLEAIEAYAEGRPLAWVDDSLDAVCHEWARGRAAPTLLVATEPARGLTEREAVRLAAWAHGLS